MREKAVQKIEPAVLAANEGRNRNRSFRVQGVGDVGIALLGGSKREVGRKIERSCRFTAFVRVV
jgi:hypothetical protein